MNHKETKEYRQLMWNNTHQTALLGDCIVSAGQWKSLLSEQQTHTHALTLAWWPCSQSPCFQATGISWSSHSPWPYIRSSTNCWSLSSRICKSTWVSLVGKWHLTDSLKKYKQYLLVFSKLFCFIRLQIIKDQSKPKCYKFNLYLKFSDFSYLSLYLVLNELGTSIHVNSTSFKENLLSIYIKR